MVNLMKIITKSFLGVTLMKQGEIKAVHDSDLINFLKSIDEYERIISGKAKCYFCEEIINLDNIMSIFPLNNEINYCCKKDNCYIKLMEWGEVDA